LERIERIYLNDRIDLYWLDGKKIEDFIADLLSTSYQKSAPDHPFVSFASKKRSSGNSGCCNIGCLLLTIPERIIN